MKRGLFVCSLLIVCLFLISPVMADEQVSKKWMVGTELDLVPYLFDGYYISAVAGYGNWRTRYVLTKITTPGFATQSGFEDNEINVNAYIVDYYFKEGFKGWWVGPGYETWKGEVKEKESGFKKHYRTDILTLGGGYTFRFNDYFYVNPWAAVHIPIGGDRNVQFVNKTFKLRATAEASKSAARSARAQRRRAAASFLPRPSSTPNLDLASSAPARAVQSPRQISRGPSMPSMRVPWT